jgi:hypothetical protein
MAFVIPVNHQDVLLKRDNRFSASEVKLGKTASVVSKIEDVSDRLTQSPMTAICENANFDLLYSVIR